MRTNQSHLSAARHGRSPSPNARSPTLSLELDGINGLVINGFTDASLGFTVVGAGDVNADGFADIFIGSFSGRSWVVFGHNSSWPSSLNVSLLDGTNGFHVYTGDERFGVSGGGAGDVNGDGIDDLIIGGHKALDSAGEQTGAAIILFGRGGSWPAELGRNDAVGSVGFLVDGPSLHSFFGRGAGDVNGDGIADFLIANNFSSRTGYTVLVFGIPDDHCAVCSNTTNDCLVCDEGFILNGTVCKIAQPVVVVIETGGGGGSAIEVAAEIAQLLGVDVGQISVVEITPGTFEVTVINEEVAQQLVTLIEQCMEEETESEQ